MGSPVCCPGIEGNWTLSGVFCTDLRSKVDPETQVQVSSNQQLLKILSSSLASKQSASLVHRHHHILLHKPMQIKTSTLGIKIIYLHIPRPSEKTRKIFGIIALEGNAALP